MSCVTSSVLPSGHWSCVLWGVPMWVCTLVQWPLCALLGRAGHWPSWLKCPASCCGCRSTGEQSRPLAQQPSGMWLLQARRCTGQALTCSAAQPCRHRCFWPIGSQGQIPTWLATWSTRPQLLQAHSLGSPMWDSRLPLPGEDLCSCDIPPVCESPAPECGSWLNHIFATPACHVEASSLYL